MPLIERGLTQHVRRARRCLSVAILGFVMAAPVAGAAGNLPTDEPSFLDMSNDQPIQTERSTVGHCSPQAEVVAAHGFSNIETIECSGNVYVFTGWLQQSFYIIRVSARTNQILSQKPVMLKPLHDQ